ncbi:MAG: hypothetical protein A2365_01535 [Candidatus Nealsonbacteria bacterium RIFOXYB1_FULL_40_15]|uniref:Phospholipid/glycerol acyltransferase domain-containing protein n=2 Tax=Candidatus Nealsoniibacteriota TaxID=1817911 RepID=A0A1G2EMG9_9BACT|nr:MAG: hypothetical protein A2427_00075 [Candidatus Nealsonbacteria bacterium RIFOXYC1_FULL_40_7]OGZ27254.1 MAG: hypothetical protein A2365_01535 [Candidatus Nealsonbacteria bacterium RIFOXYB1_FULL_40_15]
MAIHRYYQLDHSLSIQEFWGKLLVREHRLGTLVSKFFYNLLWIPLKAILSFFFRIEVESQENLSEIEGPVIIASNHASWTDSFIIGVCFPFNAKVFPIRYAVWWKYYYFVPFTFLLWLLGNFPVRKGVGLERALAVGLEKLKQGEAIGIFPTGKRERTFFKEPAKPKRGVAYLSAKTKTSVIPVKIEGNLGMKFTGFLLRKYRIKVKIGKRFNVPSKNPDDQEQLVKSSNLVMNKIAAL